MAEELTLKISGETNLPETIRIKDLTDLLVAFEDSIITTAIEDEPYLTREDLVIGLVNISKGSTDLSFLPQSPEHVMPAYRKVAHAIDTEDYSGLSNSTIDALKRITAFSRKRECLIKLGIWNGREEPLAAITPTTIVTQPGLISGETIIYGNVIRVGGHEPKIWLELHDRSTLVCQATEDTAKVLGQRIYSWVGLRGKAQWNLRGQKVINFVISEVLEYRAGSVRQAFSDIARLIGPYYADVSDPDEYFRNLREGEE